jgi:hypothetical protein
MERLDELPGVDVLEVLRPEKICIGDIRATERA